MHRKTRMKLYVVICKNSTVHKTGAHAAVHFTKKAAEAEKKTMENMNYPVEGIFVVEGLNIFPHGENAIRVYGDIPEYLDGAK